MGFSRDHLTWKALCALYEVSEQVAKRPAPKTFLLRFALAYLFQAAGSREDRRWLYDGFWRDATARANASDYFDRYCARRDTHGAIRGILHDLGWEDTADTFRAMQEALESVLPPENRTPSPFRHEGELPAWEGYQKGTKGNALDEPP